MVLGDQQEVAHEVGCDERYALRVEALEDDGRLAPVVELGGDDEQRAEALPKRHGVEIVLAHLGCEVVEVLDDTLRSAFRQLAVGHDRLERSAVDGREQ